MKGRRARAGRAGEGTAAPEHRGVIGRRPAAARTRRDRAARRCARWILRRRSLAADQFLRGACYGAGTALVGLLVVLVQSR
ncbi:hypothetical protein [Streptomyces calidiresistens]|uniref:Uncharacterized protein n=1 Tax=Streptomyces calidiresistens TaxID=1485586 RepID=A0A7W3XUV3_9ACTN|nr:hypothetical protein [Streptomyces calidiresistens]MBB0228158.1 hypothetical protein [Streptomyces calidiresistens]